jgi:hypothetical protein
MLDGKRSHVKTVPEQPHKEDGKNKREEEQKGAHYVYKCSGRSSILINNTRSLLRVRAIDGQLCKKVNGLVS